METGFELGFSPEESSELLTYLEALYKINHTEKAIDHTISLYFNNPQLGKSICDLLQTITATQPDILTNIHFQLMLDQIDCAIK